MHSMHSIIANGRGLDRECFPDAFAITRSHRLLSPAAVTSTHVHAAAWSLLLFQAVRSRTRFLCFGVCFAIKTASKGPTVLSAAGGR